MSVKKLSIVIPCYNEAENIPLILDRFKTVLKPEHDIEVILINNGSTDNSQVVLDELLPNYPFARTVLVPKNQGYGYGILQGLRETKGDYVGWTHADMQTDPNDVVKAYELLQEHIGLVGRRQTALVEQDRDDKNASLFIKGNRQGRPLFDVFFTAGMSCFETMYFGTLMYDINAQPNIFPRSFFEQWENPPYDFALDLYAFYQAKKKKLKIIRFPVDFTPRIYGHSTWNTGLQSKIKFIKRTLKFSVELRHKKSKGATKL